MKRVIRFYKGQFIMECWNCGHTWSCSNKQHTCPECESNNVSNVWED